MKVRRAQENHTHPDLVVDVGEWEKTSLYTTRIAQAVPGTGTVGGHSTGLSAGGAAVAQSLALGSTLFDRTPRVRYAATTGGGWSTASYLYTLQGFRLRLDWAGQRDGSGNQVNANQRAFVGITATSAALTADWSTGAPTDAFGVCFDAGPSSYWQWAQSIASTPSSTATTIATDHAEPMRLELYCAAGASSITAELSNLDAGTSDTHVFTGVPDTVVFLAQIKMRGADAVGPLPSYIYPSRIASFHPGDTDWGV